MIFKKKDTKEFMVYEDGKIVSIEVEQKQRQLPIEQYQQEAIPDVPIADKMRKQATSFFTRKRLKNIGLMLLLIFFVFALYDVYKVFFVTPSNPQPPGNTGVITQPDGNTTKPPVNTPEPEQTLTPTDMPSEPVDKQNESVVALLDVANQANTLMVEITSNEIANVDNYHNKQANKIGLGNQLKKSLKEKEELYVTFVNYKALFIELDMLNLYQATENRLARSIAFTKDMDSYLSSDKGSTYLLLEEYPKEDDELIQLQQNELIDILKANNISYSINEQLNQVEYAL